MKLKLLFTFALLASTLLATAQGKPEANYSQKEQVKFSQIYRYTIDHPF